MNFSMLYLADGNALAFQFPAISLRDPGSVTLSL